MGKKGESTKADAKAEAPKGEEKAAKSAADSTGKDKKWVKPERPEQPDEEGFQASKKVFEDQLEGYRAELKKLSEKIDQAQTGKESYEAEKKVLQDAFDEARGKFEELRNKQLDLIAQIKKENETNKSNREERRRIDRELGSMGENEEAIDQKIRSLEYKMQTSSMTLKAEKDIMQEIKELKKKKPQMQALAKKMQKLDEDINVAADGSAAANAGKPLDEQIKENRGEIDLAKKEKDARKAELDKLREKRQNQRKAVSKEIGEKEEIKGKMTVARDEIQKLWDAHKKKKNAYWEWERECKRIDWEIKNERWQREQEAWEAEQMKAKLEKQNERPHFDEMILIEQVQTYCNNLLNPNAKKEEAKKMDASEFEESAGADHMVLVTKKDREQEFYFAPTKGKKGKKAGNKESKTTIKHDFGTFKLFEELNKLGDKKNKKVVSAPLTLAEVPAVLDVLKEKMAFYEAKIAEWEVQREKLQKELLEAESKAAKAKADAAEADAADAANKAKDAEEKEE